jgi:hypothetical protein
MTDSSILSAARTYRAVRLILAAAAFAIAAPAAGADAQAPGSLSAPRFAAFDSVYSALVALEDAPTASSTVDVRRVCNALNRSDVLLAITRRTCLTSLKVLSASEAFAACETRRSCRAAVRRLRIAFSETLLHTRRSNRIVAAEVAPGPCRTELTASRSLLRALERFRDALRLLERGLATGNGATVRRAEGRLLAGSIELAQQPTARDAQQAFRSGCAPR